MPVSTNAAMPEPAESHGVLVAVSGSDHSCLDIQAAARLAKAWQVPWEAIYIRTPEALEHPGEGEAAARVLGVAARLGASIATIPAATVADGIVAHVAGAPASLLVLGQPRRSRWPWSRSVADRIRQLRPDLALLLTPSAAAEGPAPPRRRAKSQLSHYGFAILAVVATLLVAVALRRTTGTRALDLLLLFPIVTISARLGLKPAILAVMLAVLGYNFLLLRPVFSLDLLAPENLIVTAVLLAIAVYVSMLTSALRGRLALADRSARENSSLAAFSLRLTRLSEWEDTAEAVCEQVSAMLGVHAITFREIDGRLETTASTPSDATLTPVDRPALEWAWTHAEAAGKGTSRMSLAEWQFHPLATSLGVLAVLAIAREDGSDPVRADQAVLLSTLVAQASLAHERLRLEDLMRKG